MGFRVRKAGKRTFGGNRFTNENKQIVMILLTEDQFFQVQFTGPLQKLVGACPQSTLATELSSVRAGVRILLYYELFNFV